MEECINIFEPTKTDLLDKISDIIIKEKGYLNEKGIQSLVKLLRDKTKKQADKTDAGKKERFTTKIIRSIKTITSIATKYRPVFLHKEKIKFVDITEKMTEHTYEKGWLVRTDDQQNHARWKSTTSIETRSTLQSSYSMKQNRNGCYKGSVSSVMINKPIEKRQTAISCTNLQKVKLAYKNLLSNGCVIDHGSLKTSSKTMPNISSDIDPPSDLDFCQLRNCISSVSQAHISPTIQPQTQSLKSEYQHTLKESSHRKRGNINKWDSDKQIVIMMNDNCFKSLLTIEKHNNNNCRYASEISQIYMKIAKVIFLGVPEFKVGDLEAISKLLENHVGKTRKSQKRFFSLITSEMPNWALRGFLERDNNLNRTIKIVGNLLNRMAEYIINRKGQLLRSDINEFCMELIQHMKECDVLNYNKIHKKEKVVSNIYTEINGILPKKPAFIKTEADLNNNFQNNSKPLVAIEYLNELRKQLQINIVNNIPIDRPLESNNLNKTDINRCISTVNLQQSTNNSTEESKNNWTDKNQSERLNHNQTTQLYQTNFQQNETSNIKSAHVELDLLKTSSFPRKISKISQENNTSFRAQLATSKKLETDGFNRQSKTLVSQQKYKSGTNKVSGTKNLNTEHLKKSISNVKHACGQPVIVSCKKTTSTTGPRNQIPNGRLNFTNISSNVRKQTNTEITHDQRSSRPKSLTRRLPAKNATFVAAKNSQGTVHYDKYLKTPNTKHFTDTRQENGNNHIEEVSEIHDATKSILNNNKCDFERRYSEKKLNEDSTFSDSTNVKAPQFESSEMFPHKTKTLNNSLNSKSETKIKHKTDDNNHKITNLDIECVRNPNVPISLKSCRTYSVFKPFHRDLAKETMKEILDKKIDNSEKNLSLPPSRGSKSEGNANPYTRYKNEPAKVPNRTSRIPIRQLMQSKKQKNDKLTHTN